jgi:hypothetical protein
VESTAFRGRVKRLKEVNEIIEKLDPAIREPAFSLLAGYITGHDHRVEGAHRTGAATGEGGASRQQMSDLFGKYPDGKPSDNAILIAAWLYSQHGAQPFKLDEMREIAESVGLTIPTSLDMTLRQAQRGGKALFQHTGRGEFKPTVPGELYFRKTYQLTKGTKKRPAQGGES